MNFLITNMTGFRNKGCEGMTKVIIAELLKRFPIAKFTVFSNDPAYDALYVPTDQEIEFFITPSTPPDLLVRLYRLIRNPIRRTENHVAALREHFTWAEAIISTGGDIFSSDYGNLKHHLVPIQYATQLGKPIILLGHSIGPFKTEEERNKFIRAMQNVSLITTREKRSLEYVREMNLKNTRVELTADPAFCFPATANETVDRLWCSYHLPYDRPVIGIAASQGIASYGKASYETHFEALKKLIQYVTRELGFHVALIPHAPERTTGNDDRLICTQLYRSLGFPSEATVIALSHSAEEIKGIIGRCKLVVAERMHAAIAALSQLVPTMVVAYSVKSRGILSDIFGANEVDKYLIELRDVDEASLIYKTRCLLEREQEVSDLLKQTIPGIIGRAKTNFDLAKEILV